MKSAAVLTQPDMTLSGHGFRLLYQIGVLDLVQYANRDWLTALSYHRIDDPWRDDFDTYTPNVSATPADFRQQMEYVKAHYNAITCERLAQWLRGECELPPRPALITFDDGYSDNYQNAYPILRDLGLPATIFLSTNIIGSETPFLWDRAAYCFHRTRMTSAQLPLTGKISWSGPRDRYVVLRNWYTRVKDIPEPEQSKIIGELASELDVEIPGGAFSGLYLDWDQVRELTRNGIEMGAHTENHPVLTGVPLERAEQEILMSKKRIEVEIGKPVLSFAYPNGGPRDYSDEIKAMLRQAGIEVAFTLVPGPTRQTTVKKDPLAIRRVFVGLLDTLPRFAAKLTGVSRFTKI